MNLLVAGRITGSVLIICAYFVILHVSTFYGAIMHVIADIICIPFYIKNKQWDVAIMLDFLMIRRPPRSTPLYSSAASDVYKRQHVV